MKKILLTFLFLILCITLIGCDLKDPKYINFSSKPNSHYYTDNLRSNLLNSANFNLYVFDTNLYKEFEVSKEELSIIENFISALSYDNYTEESVDLKEPFRLKLVFDDNIYLIKVFNDSIISISPWDGVYKEDIISIKDLPLRYNLLDFCNHIANKPKSN